MDREYYETTAGVFIYVTSREQMPVNSRPQFTRKESIVEQEIRIQAERERELSLERQMLTQAKVSAPSTPVEEDKPRLNGKQHASDHARPSLFSPPVLSSPPVRSSPPMLASPPVRSSPPMLASPPLQNTGQRKVTTPKLLNMSTLPSKSKPLYQLTDSSRSPSVDVQDFAKSNPWYTSESPVQRDIRITQERNEELKVARRQSCQTDQTDKP